MTLKKKTSIAISVQKRQSPHQANTGGQTPETAAPPSAAPSAFRAASEETTFPRISTRQRQQNKTSLLPSNLLPLARMPTPLSHTSILFPSHQNTTTTNNINTLLKQLARQNLSTHNRLASIASDAAFIHQIAAHYSHLPVLANERCGSWYTPPELKGGSAYFKSTDGHNGEWGFSLRRLNVDVLRRVEEGGG